MSSLQRRICEAGRACFACARPHIRTAMRNPISPRLLGRECRVRLQNAECADTNFSKSANGPSRKPNLAWSQIASEAHPWV